MKNNPFFRSLLLLLVLLFGVGGAAATSLAATTLKESDFKQWGSLAIQDNGRRKPIDTFAREAVLKLTGRETYKDTAGRAWLPSEFLLSALLGDAPGAGADFDWTKQPMILIGYRPLVEKLGLDREKKRFTFEELAKSQELNRLAGEVHQLGMQKVDLDRMQQEVRSVSERMTLFNNLNRGSALLIVPPSPAATVKDAWVIPPDAATTFGEAKFKPVTERLQNMVKAYLAGDAFNFSLRARELRQEIRTLNPAVYPTEEELGREYFYNQLSAFPRSAMLYALGLVLLAAAALPSGLSRWLRLGGVLVALGGLIFHSWGIILRCLIAGRPPVTNMYESMVWVAFVAALFGFLFYLRYRSTTYLLAALPVSFLTVMILLQAPAAMPPSIDPLQPVLRDNFWLTVHVLTITASYGAFLLALGFGHIVLFRYLLDPASTRADAPLPFMALPHRAARRAAPRGRHHSGWGLGKLFMGPFLGLGPEGNLGAHYSALLHRRAARTHRRLLVALRSRRGERALFCRGRHGLVWRELLVPERPAFLRARRRRRRLGGVNPGH